MQHELKAEREGAEKLRSQAADSQRSGGELSQQLQEARDAQKKVGVDVEMYSRRGMCGRR